MNTDEKKLKHAAYMREWRKDNERAKEISRAANAKYRAEHPEANAESQEKYYRRVKAEDPEGFRQRANAAKRSFHLRHKNDPDYLKKKYAQRDKWRKEHPEQARESGRLAAARWRAANPEKAKASADRNRAKRYATSIETRKRIRAEVLAFFGGKCVSCGFTDERALQLDHIHGDGYLHRQSGTGTIFMQYKLIKSDPDKARATYQLLCANCNYVKRVDNGEFKKRS